MLGALMLISLTISIVSTSILLSQASLPSLGDKIVPVLTIDGPIPEQPLSPTLSDPFQFGKMTLYKTINTLDRAKDDDRVKGLVISIKSGGLSLTSIQELRNAIKRFKNTGKFVEIYTTSFGDFGNATGLYYLSSAATKIWMQPICSLSFTGINASMPFLKNALLKFGVQTDFYQRKEYKSAFEMFTHADITPANKIMMTELIDTVGQTFVVDIADDRGLSVDQVKNALDVGMLLDQEAVDAGLIDRVAYYDEFVRQIREDVTGDPESEDIDFVDLSYLSNVLGTVHGGGDSMLVMGQDKPNVAMVYITGAIMPRNANSGAYAFLPGGPVAAANEIATTIMMLAKDEDVDAIVLRIDSPGGSPSASETIRRAVVRAKEKGKLVVVSMGSAAASGGYWAATDADLIVASPLTMTGSIGVVGGKFVLQDLWKDLNVNWHDINYGKSADFWSMNKPFDTAEKQRINAYMDYVYENFVSRVAEGRGMSFDQVDHIAGGRVWLGSQAVKKGLVDVVGGLDDALDETAIMLDREGRDDLALSIYPKPKSAIQQIVKLLQGNMVAIQSLGELWGYISTNFGTDMGQVDRVVNPGHYMVFEDTQIR